MIEEGGIRVTWSYDNMYQLTRDHRDGANAYDITYSYDPAGNRRVKLEDAIRTTNAYDAANQLCYTEDNTGRTTYTFDANGNQRIVKSPAGALTTNTWDYENKLTRVILPSGTRNTFAYDADGKRVRKEDSGGTSKFIWDRENILLETNASDVIQVVYTLEPVIYGNLMSQYRSAGSSFFHFNALGSTYRLTNQVRLGCREHLVGNKFERCDPSRLQLRTCHLREPDLAVPVRHNQLLPLRRPWVNGSSYQQPWYRHRQLLV